LLAWLEIYGRQGFSVDIRAFTDVRVIV
jgi:hypothetical protein